MYLSKRVFAALFTSASLAGLLAGCGGSSSGGIGGIGIPASGNLSNPFKINGQAFFVTLDQSSRATAGRRKLAVLAWGAPTSRAQSSGNDYLTVGFKNLPRRIDPATLAGTTITVPFEPRVTLSSSDAFPDTVTLSDFRVHVRVVDLDTSGQPVDSVTLDDLTLSAGPVTLTRQADNSYVPTAGSLSVSGTPTAEQRAKLFDILSGGNPNNGAEITLDMVTASDPDLSRGTQVNVTFGKSTLHVDLNQ